MNEVLKVLCLEDSPQDAEIMRELLIDAGYNLNMDCTAAEKEFVSLLSSHKYDLILADFKLPGFDGFTALRWSVEICPDVPFICISGTIGEETAVELLKKGAVDYILKDRLIRLPSAIKRAIEQHNIQIEKRAAELLLRENEEKLQSIFSAAPVGIGLLVNQVFMEINDTFCKMTGYNRTELIGKNAETIYAKDEQNESAGIVIYRHLSEKGTGSVETRFKCKDGRILNIFLSSTPLDKDDLTRGITFIAMDITERKQAEEELLKSEGRYKVLFQNSNDAIILMNKDGSFDCNPQTLKMFKVNTKEEFFKFYPAELSPIVQPDGKNSYEASQEYINVAYQEGINRFDWTHRRTDGEDFYTEVLLSTVDFGEEQVLQCTVRDITERKRAEQTIIYEHKILRTLIDNIPDVIYIKDIDCRKVIANTADVRNIGFKEETEVLGKTDIELFPGPIGERGYTDDKKLINSGEAIIEREEDFLGKNGERCWLQTTKIPLRDKDGKITGLVGIGRDITKRKRAEEELIQSYLFSESLLKTIPFGMDIVDEKGTVLFQSDNFKKLFGEEAIGKKCWEIYRDDKKQCSECPLIKGITIGETEAYESHGVLDNRIFEISHTGMMYQGKKTMLEIFQDITDRKQSEEELIYAKEKAEEGDRLKTAFLNNISHEIRTPMNAIVGFCALLGEPDLNEQSRMDYIEVIIQSSNHLLAIISDIVDISNIEANIVKIAKNGININSTFKSLYDQFLPKVSEKKIQLICESDIPDSDALIVTDNTKLKQILINLINNAIKFTDKGYVKVGCVLRDKFLEFCVSDTGIGIGEEYYQRIFDRFYQVQLSISRLYEGTGLGLAISKANVELMGGKIWLTSEPGKGSTFFFSIPYEKQAVETLAVNEKRVPEDFVFPEKKTILVAEDIDSNFKLVRFFLSNANTEIIRAANGKEAVQKFQSNKNIDLILMDIKMPVMDGYTAVKLIRETNNTIPIIAQTAYAEDKEKAIDSGCSGFISKPFDKKSLLKVIHEFI